MMNRFIVFAVIALAFSLGRTSITDAQTPAPAPGPTLAESAAAIDRAWSERDGERVVAGYISRALLSETEGIWMFGIAAPVYDEGKLYAYRHEGVWLTVNTPKNLRSTIKHLHANPDWLATTAKA